MTASRRMVPPLALAFAALGALVVAQPADALHPPDRGADGNVATSPNTLLAVQGIFIP